MNFKELYIKTFKRDKAVIVNLLDENGHITTHWAIPEADHVNLVGVNDSILLLNESMTLSKGNVPTYYVRYDNAEPINMFDVKKGVITTERLNLVLKNKEFEKMYRATNQGSLAFDTKIIIASIILIGLFLGFFVNTKFTELSNRIPEPEPEIVEVEEV